MGRILNWAPIVQIGVLSYSVYIWQTLFLHVNNLQVFGSRTGIAGWVSSFPGNWLAILVVAFASYYAVEQPSLRARGHLVRTFHLYTARRTSANRV